LATANPYKLTTPLGANALIFYHLSAHEELSRISEFQIECLSEKGDIDLDKILGQNVTATMLMPDDEERHFNGYVTRFSQVGMRGRYHSYLATVHPWLWMLTRTSDCRIFQNMTVPEIIKKVFDDHAIADFKDELTGTYRKWEYCVQYRETDFNFVSRLMEQEGIHYFFEYGESTNTLVLADSHSAHKPCVGDYSSIPYIVAKGGIGRPDREHVSAWTCEREVQPGKYAIDTYDFKRPSVELAVKAAAAREHELADLEMYDYPGEYITTSEGDHYVQSRMDELHSQFESVHGQSDARGIAVGHSFKLFGHPRSNQNREYLLVSARHDLQAPGYESQAGTGSLYNCNFSALETKQDFRPLRTTPKPCVQGPQTAIVVGPSGDEIYTDEYGRVKVQFHWDRYGKKDEESSCWIRVSQAWAGGNWGMVAIPRIGQEVIVDFLEGDPDQPIITGRVYNAEQMPPYDLPANKTQTGVKSRSSSGGNSANFNEIRFEDKKGSEQVYIHAEKNQDIVVENDETHSVGHDRTKTIDNDETVHVKHDRTETVDNNETITIGVDRTETVGSNETITIGSNRTETVGSNETITIGANRTEQVGANETVTVAAARAMTIGGAEALTVGGARAHTVGGAEAITVGGAQAITVGAAQSVKVGAAQSIDVGAAQSTKTGADQTNTIGGAMSTTVAKDESRKVTGGRTTDIGKDDALKVAKNLVIDAGDSITIKTGSASITMKKDGTITIKGKDITIDGSGKINVKAGGDIVMKGSKILQN
jgi:type VI secretion system secreted protein VgrG